MKKEYIKLTKDRYLLKNSNGIVVSEKEIKEEVDGDNKPNIESKAKTTDKSNKVAK